MNNIIFCKKTKSPVLLVDITMYAKYMSYFPCSINFSIFDHTRSDAWCTMNHTFQCYISINWWVELIRSKFSARIFGKNLSSLMGVTLYNTRPSLICLYLLWELIHISFSIFLNIKLLKFCTLAHLHVNMSHLTVAKWLKCLNFKRLLTVLFG